MTDQSDAKQGFVGNITADMLPGLLADIARITTPEIAIAVARKHGGRRLYIPRQLTAGHPLCDLIGRPGALLLAEQLGGDRYEVPAARTILRWHDAHRMRVAGMSHAQISVHLGLTQAYVSRLLAGAPVGELVGHKPAPIQKHKKAKDERQMDMFVIT